jgi:hypothetical protein
MIQCCQEIYFRYKKENILPTIGTRHYYRDMIHKLQLGIAESLRRYESGVSYPEDERISQLVAILGKPLPQYFHLIVQKKIIRILEHLSQMAVPNTKSYLQFVCKNNKNITKALIEHSTYAIEELLYGTDAKRIVSETTALSSAFFRKLSIRKNQR